MNRHSIVNLKCPCFLFGYENFDIPSQALFNLRRARALPLGCGIEDDQNFQSTPGRSSRPVRRRRYCMVSVCQGAWVIRRMKSLGVTQSLLVEYWKCEGRVMLEYVYSVWHSSLTVAQSRSLERAHRVAMAAITVRWERSHTAKLIELGLERLELRRQRIFKRFGKRTARDSRHQDMFKINSSNRTRGEKNNKYIENCYIS